MQENETEDDIPPEFLIIGADISEMEAISMRVPIRIGINGEKIIWQDDLDPK